MGTYLTVFLIIDCLTGPILDDQLGQLLRQESHLGERFNLHSFFNDYKLKDSKAVDTIY